MKNTFSIIDIALCVVILFTAHDTYLSLLCIERIVRIKLLLKCTDSRRLVRCQINIAPLIKVHRRVFRLRFRFSTAMVRESAASVCSPHSLISEYTLGVLSCGNLHNSICAPHNMSKVGRAHISAPYIQYHMYSNGYKQVHFAQRVTPYVNASLSAPAPVCMSVSVCLCLYLSVCLSVCLSLSPPLSLSLSLYLSLSHTNIHTNDVLTITYQNT